MPRINIEDTWNVDPRRDALSKLVGSYEMADGIALKLWKMSQTYYREERLIPHSVFEAYEHAHQFLKVGLAESREDGVYIKGQCHHFQWLIDRKEAGRRGARITNDIKANRKSANHSKTQQTTPSSSSSSSSSKRKNTNTGVGGIPLVENPKQVNKWENLRDPIIAAAMARHGYSLKFCEEIWEGLLAYDEGKPYKNRKSGAVNWFNSHITKEKWERVKPEKTMREKLIEAGFEL